MRRELTDLYTRRVNEFLNRLRKARVLEGAVPLQAEFMVTDDPVAFADRLDPATPYRPIRAGENWGNAWQSGWFHITGSVPADWAGRDVVARLDFNGEACLFDASGCPVYGLTSGSVFDPTYGKDIVPLFEPCRGDEKVDLWIETAANALFGISRVPHADRLAPHRHGSYTGTVKTLQLCLFNTDLWHFWWDIEVLLDLHAGLPENAPRRNRILNGLNQAIDVFAESHANTAAARDALRPLFDVPANPADLAVTAVGHAHIDTGWLWPVRESIRKCARTFSSQVALMERYPDYVFGASQPQHYAFVKQHYPALFEKIRHYVKAGRWECQGGMWVEADCNITSGESLVRQFLHGKNFFMDEFGVDVRNLWIPDVFGYSAAMPQIMKQAGVDTFLTQKLSWSLHNEFPHNTFKWRGIDGSEVITHFPPENNYNSRLLPKPLVEAQHRLKENGIVDEFMCLFGIGNGGGGAKEEYVERGLRMRDLNGCPRVRFGTAQGFFERLRAHAAQLETWVGELYLEVHRGTLTTQAETKRGNRKLELKLRATEFLCACLPLDTYPRETLDRTWKTLLINQFHDILPGSSIRMVYENTLREYADCMATCDRLIADAAAALLVSDDAGLVLVNTLSTPYTAPLRLPPSWNGHAVLDADGAPLPVQPAADGPLVYAALPPQSFVTLRKGEPATQAATATTGDLVLENDLVRYEFDPDATLVRVLDKQRNCEVLPDGEPGNLFSLYVDRPHSWDAWDVDIWYEQQLEGHAAAVSHERLPGGDVRQALRFNLSIGESTIQQTVALAADSSRLDFETHVDWREFHKMLRVSFPTRVMADAAVYDIQYGYLERPTHRNTSWDMARFEVVGQKYVDLSDHDGGVALLNDCKYGHKVHGHVIDLNLLRAPTEPDPDADYGAHTFTYSLLPHAGALVDSDVIPQAAMLNQPPLVLAGYRAGDAAPPCRLESDGIALEVLKKAEKEECRVIRLVETRGRHSTGVLHVADATANLVETDLMEWNDGASQSCAAPIELTLAPFEIRTCKLK